MLLLDRHGGFAASEERVRRAAEAAANSFIQEGPAPAGAELAMTMAEVFR